MGYQAIVSKVCVMSLFCCCWPRGCMLSLGQAKIPVELFCLLCLCDINCEWLSFFFLSSNAGALQGIMFRHDIGFIPCTFLVPAGLAVFLFGSLVHNNLLRVILRSPRGMVIIFVFLWWYRGFCWFPWPGFGWWLFLEMADCPGKCINFC